MIQEGNEYQICFTRDDIREAAGDYRRNGNVWEWFPVDLTDAQCDAIAEEIAELFNDELCYNVHNVRNVEV